MTLTRQALEARDKELAALEQKLQAAMQDIIGKLNKVAGGREALAILMADMDKPDAEEGADYDRAEQEAGECEQQSAD